jgi:serine/threonine protein phosphatase PrpC
MTWLVSSAVAQGTSHKATNLPCQDSAAHKTITSLNASVAVISDGAGSVARSQEGSRTLVEVMCAILGAYLETVKNITRDGITSIVKVGINKVRSKLIESGDLSEFHATALILVQLPKKIFTFHIGDGSLNIGSYDNKNNITITRSEPENGEFSNETFFFTEPDWEQRMRICEVDNPCFYLVCSDGIDPFIWNSNSGTRFDFIIPLITKLGNYKSEKNGNDFLDKVITDPRTDAVTSDDKSLIIGIDDQISHKKLDSAKVYDQKQPKKVNAQDINQSIQQSLKQIVADKKKESLESKTVFVVAHTTVLSYKLVTFITVAFILLSLLIFALIFVKNPILDDLKTSLPLFKSDKKSEIVLPSKENEKPPIEEKIMIPDRDNKSSNIETETIKEGEVKIEKIKSNPPKGNEKINLPPKPIVLNVPKDHTPREKIEDTD